MTAGHKSVQAFIWALCLMAGSAYAQSSLPACQGSDTSRWTNCFGFVSYSSTEKYSGEFKDGQRHGMGVFTFFGGWKYVGEFKNYKRNGLGIYYKPDGSISATGNWSDDKLVNSFALDANRFPFNSSLAATQTPAPDTLKAERDRLVAVTQSQIPECRSAYKHNCIGTETYLSGAKYVGEYKDDKRNGQGTYTFANGDKYMGEYKYDQRTGQGTYTYANGGKFVGEYMDDKRTGQGIQYAPSGSITKQGRWENGNLVQSFAVDAQRFPFNAPTQTASAQPSTPEKVQLAAAAQSQLPPCQGSDVSRWTNCFGLASYGGDLYEGTFKNGKMDGKGRYKFTNGNNYVGEFKDGLRNGEGTTYGNTNRILGSGRWKDGQLEASYQLDSNSFSITSVSPLVTSNSGNADLLRVDRLQAEVEAERRKRQDLEQQLASSKERERIAAELDAERRKTQDVEAQLAVSPPQTSKRNAHALVIGNAAYPGSGRLDNPVNDAKAISQKLRSMGFTVTTVTDANRQKLVQSMAQFRRTAAAADISLLFYSGHGVQIFGTNYMLPTDVDQTDPAQATIQGVSLNSVVENFLPGKTKLVFLDACRDNALQRTTDRSVSKGLAPISAAEGTLISYATKDGQTASDGVGAKNSPFTQALLQHLDDPADIAVVLRKVREKVMQATAGKQQPWEYGSLTGGELVLSKIKGGR